MLFKGVGDTYPEWKGTGGGLESLRSKEVMADRVPKVQVTSCWKISRKEEMPSVA